MENKPSTAAQISELENTANHTEALLEESQLLLERWQNMLPQWQKAREYYYGGQFLIDMQAVEEGHYEEIPRGILSQDLLYNLDAATRHLAVQMVKTGASLLDDPA